MLVTFALVFLFRKSNDSNDSEFDPKDNGQPIYFKRKPKININKILEVPLIVFKNLLILKIKNS